MNTLHITITPPGRAALVNAAHDGTAPVRLAAVGLTTQPFDTASVQIPDELKRLTTFSGGVVAEDTIHITIRDETADHYTLYGFGLYLEDGTLFATYSQQEIILTKSASAMLLLAVDIRFADIDPGRITFGETSWTNPPGTQTVAGVLTLSSHAQAIAGVDDRSAVPPSALKAALDHRLGQAAPSGYAKTLIASPDATTLRQATGPGEASVMDTGAGKGLDADLLDGYHGTYYLQWRNLQDKPQTYPPSAHQHTSRDLPELASQLDALVKKSGSLMTGSLESQGTLTGDALGQGRGPALKIGNDCEFWDNNIPYAATFRSGTFPAIAQLFFGTSQQCYFGTGTKNTHTVIGARSGSLWIETADRYYYQQHDTTHVAFYKKNGGNAFFWRRSDTGGAGGAHEAELMSLQDNGNLSIAGVMVSAGGYAQGSSRKLKHIEGPLPYGLAEVEQLTTLIGRYKSSYHPDGLRRLFLDAEQLLELMPETVNAEGVRFEGAYVPSIKLDQLLPVLVKAIAQLSAKVNALTGPLSPSHAENPPEDTR